MSQRKRRALIWSDDENICSGTEIGKNFKMPNLLIFYHFQSLRADEMIILKYTLSNI
jgi:hypothetical protein